MWPDSIPMSYCSYGSYVGYTSPRGVNAFPSDLAASASPSTCVFNSSGQQICTGGGYPDSHPYCGFMAYSGSAPKATMQVYTKPKDQDGNALHALYRFSFVEPTTTTGRHYFATGPLGATPSSLGVSSVWRMDGIEGYVYPASGAANINGTVGLYRLVRPANATQQAAYTLSLEDDLSHWYGRGFQQPTLIGWAYRHRCNGATPLPLGC